MSSVITDVGREWISEVVVDANSEQAYIVAVGDGTSTPVAGDTSMESELYRANDDDSNCTVDVTSDTGAVVGRITVSGGTEVPAGSSVGEFGLISDGGNTLVYHEVRSTPVTVQSGDRKTFEFTITFESG